MKEKAKYGFIGTAGLFIMVISGLFITGMGVLVVYKLMNGMALDQTPSFLGTIFLGGVLPYLTGAMMFWWGKKVGPTRR